MERNPPARSYQKKITMFKIKKVKPLFTGVITTATKYQYENSTDGGIILMNQITGGYNEFQRVIAAGRTCTDLEPGKIVKINYNRYKYPIHRPGAIDEQTNIQSDNLSSKCEPPIIKINGKECLFIQYNDIEYIVEECEVDDGGLLQ